MPDAPAIVGRWRARALLALVLVMAAATGAGFARLSQRLDDTSIVKPVVDRPAATAMSHVTSPGSPPQEGSIDPTADAVARYDAMRDEPNPKPRLQAIDAWARVSPPDAPLDLLTHALVDPDPSVRARAQELFDRRIVRR